MYDDGWVEQGGNKHFSQNIVYTISLPITMADKKYSLTFDAAFEDSDRIVYPLIGQNKLATSFAIISSSNVSNVWCGWKVAGMSARGATQQNIICIKYYYLIIEYIDDVKTFRILKTDV